MTNTEALKDAIQRSGIKFEKIAEVCCITTQTLRNKINGDNQFKLEEVQKIRVLLDLDNDAVNAIFFNNNVD